MKGRSLSCARTTAAKVTAAGRGWGRPQPVSYSANAADATQCNGTPPRWVLFTRHGHRAPAKAIEIDPISEARQWDALLPTDEEIHSVNQRFSITNHNVSEPIDLKTRPFGCLTRKGMSHMAQAGQYLSAEFQNINDLSVHVISTNFRRTQVELLRIFSSVVITSLNS